MSIKVAGPNGISVEFPDGMTAGEIHQVMEGHFGGGQAQAEPQTGMLEAFGRAALDTATFGLSRAWTDPERDAQARHEHPYASFAGDFAGFGPTLALGPAAAAMRAGSTGAKVIGGAARVLAPELATETLGGAAVQGLKAGGAGGALHGAGATVGETIHGEGRLADLPGRVATEGAMGALTGGALGPVIHSASRAVQAGLRHVVPGLDEIRQAAANGPSIEGVNDLARQMRFDGQSPRTLDARVNVEVPNGAMMSDLHPGNAAAPPIAMSEHVARQIAAEAHTGTPHAEIAKRYGTTPEVVADIAHQDATLRFRFADLNPLEAMTTGHLRQAPHTGQLVPEIITAPNTAQHAQWAANMEGQGRQEVRQAFAERNSSLGDLTQRDIDQMYGSGNRQARADALESEREAVGRRYDRMRDRGQWLDVPNFGGMEHNPLFQQALDKAAMRSSARSPSEGYQRWQAPDPNPHFVPAGEHVVDARGRPVLDVNGQPVISDGTVPAPGTNFGNTTLSPQNILDIHSVLSESAKMPLGGHNPDSVNNGLLLRNFKEWVREQTGGTRYDSLHADYRRVLERMEAGDMGRAMPIKGGGPDHESLAYFRQHEARRQQAQAEHQAAQHELDDLRARGVRQQGTTRAVSRLRTAEANLRHEGAIVEEFRAAVGEGLKAQLATANTPAAVATVVSSMLSQEGKSRIMAVLGREQGSRFIAALYNKRKQLDLGGTLYGGPNTAFKLGKANRMDAAARAVSALIHMRPSELAQSALDIASNAHSQARSDAFNRLMAGQGIDHIRDVANQLVALHQRGTPAPRAHNAFMSAVVPADRSITERVRR